MKRKLSDRKSQPGQSARDRRTIHNTWAIIGQSEPGKPNPPQVPAADGFALPPAGGVQHRIFKDERMLPKLYRKNIALYQLTFG